MQLFSPNQSTGQIPSNILHVYVFVCLSVFLRHRKTSTSGGQNKFWSNVVTFTLPLNEIVVNLSKFTHDKPIFVQFLYFQCFFKNVSSIAFKK